MSPKILLPLDDAYRAFIGGQQSTTLWSDPDFLAILSKQISGSVWAYAKTVHDGQVVGVAPYLQVRKFWGKEAPTPQLLRYMAPVLGDELLVADRVTVLRDLANQITAGQQLVDIYWPPQFAPILSQQTHDFTSRTTYFADVSGSPDDILGRANKSMRRRLRRADEYFSCEEGPLTDENIVMQRKPFLDQGERGTPYNEALLQQSFDLFSARKQASCVSAFTPEGALAASSVCLWDKHRMYLWVIGSSTEMGNQNAGSYLYYQMLLLANRLGLKEVDFLGSMLPGPAENRRQLGAVPCEYPHLCFRGSVLARLAARWRERN